MKDTLHALRLYASPVFFRENGSLVGAGFYIVLLALQTFSHLHDTKLWQHGHFHQPTTLATWWWLAQQMLFAGIANQYWRQVRSPLASLYPRMLAAEYRAILIVLGFGIVAMLLPMLLVGAPALNVAALEAVSLPMTLGSDIAGPRVLRSRMRWLRLALIMLVFIMFMIPSMQDRILAAPWFVALGLIVLGATLAFIELQHSPMPVDTATADGKPRQQKPARTIGHRPAAVLRVLSWQPPWTRRMPVPQSFDATAPLLSMLGIISLTVVFMLGATAFNAVSHRHWPQWHDALSGAQSVPRFICMISAMGLSSWLLSRRDWPFLFVLGPFGNRAVFTRRLYRAHAFRAVQTVTITALLSTGIACASGMTPLSRLPAATAAIACAMLAAAYVPSLTVFATRAPRPGITQFLITITSTIGVQLAVAFFLETHHVPVWSWAIAAMIVPFCIAIDRLAPAALARTDWPIEPPAP